jgi:hypothetical protein
LKNKDGGVKNTAAERQSLNYAKLSLKPGDPPGRPYTNISPQGMRRRHCGGDFDGSPKIKTFTPRQGLGYPRYRDRST